jgi:hypothetical protein
MADSVLAGAFTGDFAVALERAAAFCRVVSTGWACSPTTTRTPSTRRPGPVRRPTSCGPGSSSSSPPSAGARGLLA